MGTLLDLPMTSSHDYVDNSFWSVMQIKVKYLTKHILNKSAPNEEKPISDEDLGKVKQN